MSAAPDPASATAPPDRKRRGLAWVIGSFAVCPCHLPLTLGLVVTLAGGTAFGALLHKHIVLAGIVIATAWAFGLWRGLRLLRQPAACPVPGVRRRRRETVREFLGLPPAVRARPHADHT